MQESSCWSKQLYKAETRRLTQLCVRPKSISDVVFRVIQLLRPTDSYPPLVMIQNSCFPFFGTLIKRNESLKKGAIMNRQSIAWKLRISDEFIQVTPHISTRQLWTSCVLYKDTDLKNISGPSHPRCTGHSCFLSPWLTRKALSWCYGSIMSPPRRDWAHVNTCDETVRRCRLAAGSSRRCCCCHRPWVWLRAEIVKVTRVRTLFGQECYENMHNYLVELFVYRFVFSDEMRGGKKKKQFNLSKLYIKLVIM